MECIRLPTDTGTSRLKGFGYAEFKDVDNLLAAVQLNSEVGGEGRGGEGSPVSRVWNRYHCKYVQRCCIV